jgi:hypothetical protein
MNKYKMINKITILFIFFAATMTIAVAQRKINEGMITYALTYDLSADQQQHSEKLPTEIICYFRSDSTAAIAIQDGTLVKGVSVFKTDYHSLIIDIPALSKKLLVVMTPEEVEQEKAGLPKFTFAAGSGKAFINGFNCSKGTLTDSKTGSSYEIWFTNDIEIPVTSVSRVAAGLHGVPIRFVTFNNGYKINAVVKDVKEQHVPMGFFTATKDYVAISYGELKSM